LPKSAPYIYFVTHLIKRILVQGFCPIILSAALQLKYDNNIAHVKQNVISSVTTYTVADLRLGSRNLIKLTQNLACPNG
jgi:hypothetical protein